MTTAAGVSTLEQFVRFATDAYGLERTLRLLQAVTQLLISYPSLFLFFLHPLPASLLSSSSPSSSPSSLLLLSRTLPHLRSRLATLRRSLRLFRFLDAFASAWSAYVSTSAAPAAAARASAALKWLDVASRSFNGMYLLLESATFLEALDVPGLGVWGDDAAAVLAVEAQRFWFFSLACAVVAAGGRLVFWGDDDCAGAEGRKEGEGGRREKEGQWEAAAAAAAAKKEGIKERATRRKMVRRMVADVLDLAVPGSVVGWVPFSAGTVSFLMFWSTILTGMEVWEKCGRELAAVKDAASRAGRKGN
ncbi:hypothetical protein VTK26DRAFT_4716 [Humicola hyalothermophila]